MCPVALSAENENLVEKLKTKTEECSALESQVVWLKCTINGVKDCLLTAKQSSSQPKSDIDDTSDREQEIVKLKHENEKLVTMNLKMAKHLERDEVTRRWAEMARKCNVKEMKIDNW